RAPRAAAPGGIASLKPWVGRPKANAPERGGLRSGALALLSGYGLRRFSSGSARGLSFGGSRFGSARGSLRGGGASRRGSLRGGGASRRGSARRAGRADGRGRLPDLRSRGDAAVAESWAAG